eukprot:2122838-Karenia_brevis.AAC.1
MQLTDAAPLAFWCLLQHFHLMSVHSWSTFGYQQRQAVIALCDFLDCYRLCPDFWSGDLAVDELVPSLSV